MRNALRLLTKIQMSEFMKTIKRLLKVLSFTYLPMAAFIYWQEFPENTWSEGLGNMLSIWEILLWIGFVIFAISAMAYSYVIGKMKETVERDADVSADKFEEAKKQKNIFRKIKNNWTIKLFFPVRIMFLLYVGWVGNWGLFAALVASLCGVWLYYTIADTGETEMSKIINAYSS